MRKNLLALILVFTFVFPASLAAQTATKKNSPAMKAAMNITAKQMSDYLYFIASDAMEGRDTPSRGLDTTAEFIKMNLSQWGFKPAGDNGTYFQKIALRRDSIDTAAAKLSIDGKNFVYGEDYFITLSGDSTGDAPLVFGKDGWMVKSKNIDALAGIDVKGKVVVLSAANFSQRYMLAMPAGVSADDLKGTRGVDWNDPVGNARAKGATGVIVIAPPQLQAIWEQVRGFFSRGNIFPEKLREGTGATQSTMPVMLASGKVGEALGISAGSGSLTAQNGNLSAVSKTEMLSTQNVVAIWEGSDPVLKNEMVAIGAHYDHIGISQNAKGEDKINNGADDDGSGTTGVLAIAEALAKSAKRPKRSVLFVWHCGEEKGLWGSEYFTKFPTVDLKSVVAQLNIDMIGRSRLAGDTDKRNAELSTENEIYVIGSKMMSTELGTVSESINNSFLKLNYNYKYDDPKDPNRFFFRSDHFNYASKGIPIIFWFDGVHQDYHQVGDSPDKIDYAKMEKVTRTIFLTLWELSDAKARPVVDKQLPAELMTR
ncbi:MAG: M28 family peptidase [Pyrinomonadaceae bacterium]